MTITTAGAASVTRVLESLQDHIGEGNAKRGFHAEGDRLRAEYAENYDGSAANLRNYQMAKLALIGTEIAEAVEELRNGRAVDEVYYTLPHPHDKVRYPDAASAHDAAAEIFGAITAAESIVPKPEGFLSELADVMIRGWDFADEDTLPLASMIFEKLEYNATRAAMHGGKKI